MVALLDMDAFFASLECARNTFLKNKPVAVIGWGKRTAVCSVNYVAKSFGVKVGMSPQMAKRNCKDLVFVKADFEYYEESSLKIEEIIEKTFPRYIRYSIDEFFIDLNVPESLEKLSMVKKQILCKTGATCTIGVAPNPILSKVVCEISKPNGFKILHQEEIEEFFKKAEINLIPGVGKKTSEYLEKRGVKTIEDLIEFSRFDFCPNPIREISQSLLTFDFDRKGFFKKNPPKSFGHIKTLDANVEDIDLLKEICFYLSYKAALRMIREGYRAKTVSLVIRYAKYQTVSISKTLSQPTCDFLVLAKVVEALVEKLFCGDPVRMVGVSFSNLIPLTTNQLDLFENREKLLKAMSLRNIQISSVLCLRIPRSVE